MGKAVDIAHYDQLLVFAYMHVFNQKQMFAFQLKTFNKQD
jgi:hypothetical protein